MSGTLFSEDVPPELHPFFRDRARVRAMRRLEDGGWTDVRGQPKEDLPGLVTKEPN